MHRSSGADELRAGDVLRCCTGAIASAAAQAAQQRTRRTTSSEQSEERCFTGNGCSAKIAKQSEVDGADCRSSSNCHRYGKNGLGSGTRRYPRNPVAEAAGNFPHVFPCTVSKFPKTSATSGCREFDAPHSCEQAVDATGAEFLRSAAALENAVQSNRTGARPRLAAGSTFYGPGANLVGSTPAAQRAEFEVCVDDAGPTHLSNATDFFR